MGADELRRVHEIIALYHKDAVDLSNDLAANPELSYEEYESSRKIIELLQKNGFEIECPFMGFETAFHTVIDNGEGPEVAIMVEYDALPELGHACGHNVHGSISVLAALGLSDLKDMFKGKIHVVGTPGEECEGAKIHMANQGFFDNMAASVMIHCCGGGVCQPNMDALGLRCYTFKFSGKPAHAVACPWEGRSALAAARKFIDLIDARRECFTSDIYFNSIIVDGGKAPNIIPEHSEVRVEFRTASMANLGIIDDIVIACAKGSAMAMGCDVCWKKEFEDFADMVRVHSLEVEVKKILESLGQKVEEVSPPLGTTDVGNVSYHCPSIQPLLAITKEQYSLHTIEFAKCTEEKEAYKAMACGAEALVILILKIFNDNIFKDNVYRDFTDELSKKMNT